MSQPNGSLSFGAELRSLRLRAGLSLQALAVLIHFSRSHLSKIENGIKRPTEALARQCDTALHTGGALVALVPPATRPPTRYTPVPEQMSLDDFAMISVVAGEAHAFEIVPTRELSTSPAGKQRRQSRPAPPRPWNDPLVVSRYRGVFDQLRELGQVVRPHDVIPSLTMHTRTLTDMARSAEPSIRDDLFLLAARFAEYTGWMAQEQGQNDWAVAWTDWAADLARRGGGDMSAYRLVRLGDLAMYGGRAAQTIELATTAMHTAKDTRVRGLAAQRLAHGHALARDRGACLRALELSDQLLSNDEPQQTGVAHPVVGSSTVADHAAMAKGWCLFDLGAAREAAEILSVEVQRLPVQAHRARTRYGARLALCYAEMGEVELACSTAEPILGSLRFLDSATIRVDVSALETRLRRSYKHAAVKGLMPLLADARPHVRPAHGYGS